MDNEERLWALAQTGDDEGAAHLYTLLKRQGRLADGGTLERLSKCVRDPALRIAFGIPTDMSFMDLCAHLRRNESPERLQRLNRCLDHWPITTRCVGPTLWDWMRQPPKPRRHPGWDLARHLQIEPHQLTWLQTEPILKTITSLSLVTHYISFNRNPDGTFNDPPDVDFARILQDIPTDAYANIEHLNLQFSELNHLQTIFKMANCWVNVQHLQIGSWDLLTQQLIHILHPSTFPLLTHLNIVDSPRLCWSKDATGVWYTHANWRRPTMRYERGERIFQPLLDVLIQFPKLTHLDLQNCGVADLEATMLAQSPLLKRLEWLGLHHNPLTEEGVRALRASPYSHPSLHIGLDTIAPLAMRIV